MSWHAVLVSCIGTLVVTSSVQAQPQLDLQGEPYFNGSMTLSVTAEDEIGELIWLGLGLNPLPLDAPIQTGKGPFYIGLLTHSLILGPIPPSGRLDLPFLMPAPIPGTEGLQLPLQVIAGVQLSNPATVHLDLPYYQGPDATILVSPEPSQIGHFGDRTAAGDLNDDGEVDLVVGAWWEDVAGVDRAGRVYVFWGPSFSQSTTLAPTAPKPLGAFGIGVAVGDLDGDEIDDLVVGEATGSPPPPTETGTLNIFFGGQNFDPALPLQRSSLGMGVEYANFGRILAVGDFDDNGSVDIAAGISSATVGVHDHAGRVDVYWGPSFLTTTSIENPDPAADDFFGDTLLALDATGEGVDDLLAASVREDLMGFADAGQAHLYTFDDTAPIPVSVIENPIPETGSRFGNALVGADLNGDGLAEIFISDERKQVFLFWSPTYEDFETLERPAPALIGEENSVSFGYYAVAGDVNGDGLVDLVVSDVFSGTLSGCSLSKGGVVFVGLGPYFATWYTLFDVVPECGSEFGWSVLLRNFDADERLELAVGSDTATPFGLPPGAGRVTVFDFD